MHENYPWQISGGPREEAGFFSLLPSRKAPCLEQLPPPAGPEADPARGLGPPDAAVIARPRKSGFLRPFDGTATGLVCNRFYQLVLSNGCPFNCRYCYLRLTLGGNKGPVIFTNPWPEVERQLEKIPVGVFSTGELADSLAITPPLLQPVLEYFRRRQDKFLFLTTKSTNIDVLLRMPPTPQVWISFSLNAVKTWELFENNTPHPHARLAAAWRLKEAGWRVRVRIDPIIPEIGIESYREIARRVRALAPERVTLGVLKQFPRLPRCRREGIEGQLAGSPNGIKRYPLPLKIRVFNTLADWLGRQPAVCRETPGLWEALGWNADGCNCTPAQPATGLCPEAKSVTSEIFMARRTSTHG
jgi:spore photoproduct lyase